MKKILLLMLLPLLFACGNEVSSPENQIESVEAKIVIPDTIYLNKSIDILTETLVAFNKVEYYIDGELIGTSINENYRLSWRPQDVSAGANSVKIVAYTSNKTYEFASTTFLKLSVGDKYGGGTVINVFENGTSGLVAADYDIKDDYDDDYRFRWTLNMTSIGANSEDGKTNTDLIIKSFSEENSTFAKFLKDGVSIGGFKDWYVPSLEESKKIDKDIVPNLRLDQYYWTSTETDANMAVFYHFRGTMMGTNQAKNYLYYIRLVRKI